jgi:parvulin-like peptidyl-prolyl isomerase
MTKAQFSELYSIYMDRLAKEIGFTEEDFRRVFEAIILRRKLWEAIADEVPTREEQVHARQIVVEKEEEALEVIERLEAGEDFVALAKELSIDEATKEEGGDLGWFVRDGFGVPKELAEVAFGLEVGQISEPISTTLGYHIIEVLGREERELDLFILRFRREEAFENWLSAKRQSEKVKRYWSPDKVPP